MNSYNIKKISRGEFQRLIPLMQDCFGMDVDIDYFEWKFAKNPNGFVEGYIAETENGEVAAYYGAIPETYSINGKPVTIYQSCDTMTHSEHRRKGLFQKLAVHCYEALRQENKLFVIGFGGDKSMPGLLKFGWVPVFNMRYYFIPKLFAFFTARNNPNIELVENINLLEPLILRSNNRAEIHSNKTLDIFKWRISNPRFKYKIMGYKSGEKYTGYLCYYLDEGRLMLFDFYFENMQEGKSLISALKNILSKVKVKGIVAFVQEFAHQAITLKQLGFLNNPLSKGPLSTRVPFTFYADKETQNKLNDPDLWLITTFDHDAL